MIGICGGWSLPPRRADQPGDNHKHPGFDGRRRAFHRTGERPGNVPGYHGLGLPNLIIGIEASLLLFLFEFFEDLTAVEQMSG